MHALFVAENSIRTRRLNPDEKTHRGKQIESFVKGSIRLISLVCMPAVSHKTDTSIFCVRNNVQCYFISGWRAASCFEGMAARTLRKFIELHGRYLLLSGWNRQWHLCAQVSSPSNYGGMHGSHVGWQEQERKSISQHGAANLLYYPCVAA